MTAIKPFRPAPGGGGTLSVTDSTGDRVEIPGAGERQIEITNTGDNEAHLRLGGSSVQAVVDSDLCLPSGHSRLYSVNSGDTHLGGRCASGESTTIKICIGHGN